MKIDFYWEPCGDDGNMNRWTWRSKVIGGWLVKEEVYAKPMKECYTFQDENVLSVSMVFIVDPNHEWEI